MPHLSSHHRIRALAMALLTIFICLVSKAQAAAATPPRIQPPPSQPAPMAPEQKVFQLLQTLKNAPDADQREQAAQALASFDSVRFFEIVPALIHALQHDSDKNVRRACVSALAELKPASEEVLQALTEAAEKDAHWRVRWAARSAKRGYRVQQQPMVPQAQNDLDTTKDTPISVPTLKAPELPQVTPSNTQDKSSASSDAPKKSKWFRLDFWRKSDKQKDESVITPTLPPASKSKNKEVKPILQAPPLPS